MTGAKVVAALTQAAAEREGTPMSITCDNGSEFASRIVQVWAWTMRCSSASFVLAGQSKTDLRKALTVGYGMSVSMSVGFPRLPMPTGSYLIGVFITTNSGPIVRWTIARLRYSLSSISNALRLPPGLRQPVKTLFAGC